MSRITDFFKLRERNTSYEKKLIAGITMPMTMACVLAVQPGVIVGYGDAASTIDANSVMTTREAIAVTRVIIGGLVMPLMALYANPPFTLAINMGSSFMLGALIQSQRLPSDGAMAMTLISDIILLSLITSDIRSSIVEAIPKDIKASIGAVVGFFITYLGFRNTGIVALTESGVSARNFIGPTVMLAILGLVVIAILTAHKVNDIVLIGIITVTFLGTPVRVIIAPSTFTKIPDFTGLGNVMLNLDSKSVFSFSSVILTFTAFCGDFFSILGIILGVNTRAGVLDENGDLPNIQQPFLVDAIDTCIGAPIDNMIITISVKSSAGVETGRYTGFTSVVVSVTFVTMVFLPPLVLMIPSAVVGPALISVGFLMTSGFKDTGLADFIESFGPFVVIMLAVLTGSIANGISANIPAFVSIKIATDKSGKVHPIMYVMAIPLTCHFIYR